MLSEPSVLLVKGEKSQFEQLKTVIEEFGLSHITVESSAAAIEQFSVNPPSLILMDLLIDGKDAIDLLKEIEMLEARQSCTCVVFSERKENYVQITSLNSGADDFIVKPVNKHVFASRLNSWMRAYAGKARVNTSGIAITEMVLDEEKFSAVVKNKEVVLQRKEFEIMSLLVSKPKKVFSRDEIKGLVWENANGVRNRTIDVHIRNLRIKIGPKYIKTYKGIGYSYVG